MAKILIEAGLIIGILVIVILIYFQKRNRNHNNYFLILALASAWYSLLVNSLNQSRHILEYPFLIRTGNITAYLIFSFFYLYARNTFYPGRFWQKKDFILLIPSCLYIIDMLPFFFSSSEYKIAVMRANLDNPGRMFLVAEGWIGIKGFHLVFRYLWSMLIVTLLIRLIYRNRLMGSNSKDSPNRALFWFIITLAALQLPLIIPGIFGAAFHLKWYTLQYMNISLAMVNIATTIYIFFSPMVLYGFLPQLVIPENADNLVVTSFPVEIVEKSAGKELSKLTIPENDIQEILELIQNFMLEKRPYTDQHYTIHDLSRDIDVPVYQLSPIINNYYQTNFNSWLNSYRVNYFIKISQEEGKHELTLDAIAREAGFNNRTTFINAFKKEKGTTPGQFIKSAQISH